MPGEVLLAATSRLLVRSVERRLDRVAELGQELSPSAREGAASAGTAVLVSGFGGSTRGLGPIMRSLSRDGVAARAVQIPDGGVASARAAVTELDRAIAAIPDGPIHLAGHSKGAIVAQLWFAEAAPELQRRVQSMTLMASTPTGQRLSPWQQMQSALLEPVTGPFSRSVAEAQATHRVMRRIREADIASRMRGLSIVSERDGLIKVPEATWDGARTLVLRGDDAPDHMHMLVSDAVYDALRGNILATSR